LENGHRLSLDADTEESQLVDVSSVPDSVHPPRNIKDVHASPIQKSISAQEAHRRGANPVSHLVISSPNTPMHSHATLDTVSDRTTYEVHEEQREGGGDEMNSGESTEYESGTDEPLEFASRHQFSSSQTLTHTRQKRFRTFGTLPTSMDTSTSRSLSSFNTFMERLKSFVGTLDDIMTPPLYGAITSLIVALIPPVQTFLKDHMKPLTGALKNTGECSIPITLIVLGGYFYTPPEEVSTSTSQITPQHKFGDRAGDTSQSVRIANETSSSNQSSSSRTTSAKSLSSIPPTSNLVPLHTLTQTFTTTRRRRNRSLLSSSWEKSQSGETKTIIVALVSRMLIVPILIFPLFWLSLKIGWQDVFAE
jgi:hypothetical protein